MTLSARARLGPYEIVSLLGSGGMGEVYRARDTRLDRTVAIKVLRAHLSAHPDRRRRFQREAKTISRLNHPHICTLFDVGQQHPSTSSGQAVDYLVMEYLEGQTLAERLGESPLAVEQALQYAIQIADALHAAHQQGIVHRDLKPANVMLTKAGTKLLDFGIAKAIGPHDGGLDVPTGAMSSEGSVRFQPDGDLELPPTLTADGTLLGTVQYMSPEQLEGRDADVRSDLFAFGAVLYEMLTGRRAFTGESRSKVIVAVLDTEPPPIGASRPLVPPALDHLVQTCLAKNPDQRWQNADDLRRRLHEIAVGSGQDRASRRLLKYGVAVTVAIMLAAAFLWQRMKPGPLTDNDVLVLAEFTNNTGDAVFDGTLRQALAFQLERSQFLKIMGDAQVRKDLQFMGRAPDERITNEIARDICRRENERAIIGGSIGSLGKSYVLAIEATNCQTGDTLAREQAQAEDKEHVLAAVAGAVTGVRGKLGESLGSIQKLDRPFLGQVTTTSLEAVQAYSLGLTQLVRGESLAAIPLLRRATDLDPDFAMAWVQLSIAYQGVQGSNTRALECEKKAFALVDRVWGERERLFITCNYYRDVIGDLAKFREVSELHVSTYPRDGVPHFNLAQLHTFSGDFEKAARELEQHNRLLPGVGPAYVALILAYARLERFDQAKTAAEEAFAQKLDGPAIHATLLAVAHRKGDRVAEQREIQWFTGKPEEYQSLSGQAGNAKLLGQRRAARELLQRAATVARRWNLPDTVDGLLAPDPLGDALMGDCETARGRVPAPALALALCGDAAGAEKAANEFSKQRPNHTGWNETILPVIRAANELTREQPAMALDLLQRAVPYERGQVQVLYMHGLALQRLGKGAEAAAQFRRILDHRGAYWGPYYPPSFVGLGRAFRLAGDTVKARKAYEDFFSFWKDADADIPLLIEARKEYAALKKA